MTFKSYGLMVATLLPLLAAGCGGLHARGSVSPIDFLLPGAGHLLHAPLPEPTATNFIVAVSELDIYSGPRAVQPARRAALVLF